MPNASRSRTIAASTEELWAVVSDPHHLPRWWPRVTRVEDVHDGAFTEVMKTRNGKTVRADFDVVLADPGTHTVRWDQRIEGTPFAGVLSSSETELRLTPVAAPAAGATEVTIEMRQEMSDGRTAAPPATRSFGRLGFSWGARLVRRAATATIDEALEGLERISV